MPKTIQDTIFAGGGLNTDDAYRFMAPTDAPYRLHVTPVGEGENGVLTNMKGCEHVVLPITITFTSSEVYSVVGSHYNASTRACYYFIHSLPYDSGGGVYKYDNKLLRYNTDTDNVELIFLDEANYLGLSHDTLMKDIRMIETWLYFNPKGTEPKMIDVDMAYNYANNDAYNASLSYVTGDVRTFKGGLFYANQAVDVGHTPSTHTAKWDRIGSCYSGESYFGQMEFEFCFDTIKQPPVKELTLTYASEPYYAAGYGANNVRGKVFKFAYRYQYHDSAYSLFSAHSAPTLPPDGEVYNGEIVGISTENNHIVIILPLGLPSIIKAVDLVFKEGEGDWKIATTIDRRDQSLLNAEALDYSFYNNEAYSSIDNELPEKVIDAVPREAGCQEVINLNILAYGRCKEGFDSLSEDEMDVTLTPIPVKLEQSYATDTLLRDNGYARIIGVTTPPMQTTGYWTAYTEQVQDPFPPIPQLTYYTLYHCRLNVAGISGLPLQAGDIFSITLDGNKLDYAFSLSDISDDESVADAIAAFLTKAYGWGDVLSAEVSGNWTVDISRTHNYPQVWECRFIRPSASIAAIAKQSGFKTGAVHPFCIFYYDKNMRRGDANVCSDTSVYVPQFVEDGDVDGIDYKYSIGWEVNHEPPSEARYWSWGKAKNKLTDYFVEYVISDYGDEGNFSYFDITPLQILKTVDATDPTYDKWNQFPNSVIDEWVWEQGDRVRVKTVANDPDTALVPIGALVDRIFDYEIVKYDKDTKRIYIQKEDNPLIASVGENSLIEIYRPTKESPEGSDLFYEFGPLMAVITDSSGERVHRGITQNQDTGASLSATGTFASGDVYHIVRTPSKYLLDGSPTVGVFHESMHYSDFYISDYWGGGKIGIVSRIGEQTLNIIRYSNTYVQGTQLNGLTTFEAGNYKEVNDIYGQIRAMREVGDTLKVYQDVKSSSILIGRQEYSDSAGNEQVVTSNRVLGSIRYSPTSYGTIFPESVTKNNRYVYLFDVYNGAVCRDSANGIFPISGRFEAVDGRGSYKMETYFKEKAKAFLASGVENVKVMTVWDEEYGFLYVTFVDKANADNNDTIVFHEGSNRWITFADLSREDTWNEFLFPTYEVIDGFPNGLNESFDEQDGFTTFTLATGTNSSTLPTYPTMTIEALGVSTTSSPSISAGLQALTIAPLAVTVEITDVDISPTSKTWTATQYGATVKEQFTITTTLGGEISAKPSWITVKRQSGATIGVLDTVEDAEVLDIYPTSANTGAERSGSFTVVDNDSNSATATLTQQVAATVTVSVIGGDAPFELISGSGTNAAGSNKVFITFTPDDGSSGMGGGFFCYYSILKNGVGAGTGSFLATNLEENTETLTMTGVSSGGDTIVVTLGNDY